MADEQYRWLDRGTAERFLNGEPPAAADPTTRDQAERLAGTLRSLSAPPPSPDEELPGEAAALAAFRKVREEREGEPAVDAGAVHRAGAKSADLGPVRIGTTREDRSGTGDGPGRPRFLRLGLAAALVAGMVGGAAVLAGAGVLPTPSDAPRSDPAASVTATASHPERPLVSPPPGDGATPGEAHSRDAAGKGEEGAGAQGDGDAGSDGVGTPGRTGSDAGDPAARSGRGWKQFASACRAWRDGRQLNGDRRRLLENEAGGPSHVRGYCEDALSMNEADKADDADTTGSEADDDTGEDNGNGKSSGSGNGKTNGNGGGNGNGKGRGGGKQNGHDPDKGDGGGQGQGNGRGNRP
ncbi:hypothetical protein GCM10010297_01440 [Streptomyces malachitofuscus]|nr:hypothetical protein GCM10010297_01440 [Streptomyces malachitofuscus]